MGAASYVGRVGALAVALGIGVAVFGVGVASADTAGTSGSEGSSSSTSSSSASTSNKGTSASDGKDPSGAKTGSASKDGAPTGNSSSTTDTSGSVGPTGTSSDDTTESAPATPSVAKPKKKSPVTTNSGASTNSRASASTLAKSGATTDPTHGPDSTTKTSTPKEPTEAASTHPVDDTSTPAAGSPETTAPKAVATVVPVAVAAVEPTRSVTVPAAPSDKAPSDTAPVAPSDTVAAITQVASALLSPFAGNSPSDPIESPISWMATAAARKEFDASPTVAKKTDPVTTAAPADPSSITTAAVAAQSAALVAPAYPTNVVAIPQIPLLTALGLQNIPIVGPLFVTPIVAIVNSIPIVGDLLHPIFGYPVQTGLPAGSPQARDVTVISFDGTPINVHFMPAAGLLAGVKAPTILDGPGLGEPGATNLNGTPLDGVIQDNLGVVGVGTLRDAGYNVVTWDPRGEYFSGGTLELDSPDYEARDVSSIISWIATQPEAQLDGVNDPRIGMVGASYGGGIQLVTAATDHRVDAIVPTIAWNTLNYALYPNQDYKTGWGTLLTAALLGTFARPNPAVYPSAIYGALTGTLTQDEQDLLTARGPGGPLDLVSQITAPTLLFQGTVDTLFPLSEANLNADALIAAGVPTKVVWFCGGHGVCVNDLLDLRDGAVVGDETMAWLDRYVKGDTSAVTGPQFQWVDQRGQYYSADTYPVPTGTPVVASSSAPSFLPLVPLLGGSGPLLGVLPIGGTPAFNAINLKIPAVTTTTYVVGAPQLTFTYDGTGSSRFVYAQLVDDSTGLVLGNQVTPVPVTLNGQTHTASIPLNMVAATLNPGQTLTLQLVASSADFLTISSFGSMTVSGMTLSLPTADPSAVTATTVV